MGLLRARRLQWSLKESPCPQAARGEGRGQWEEKGKGGPVVSE